MGNRVSIIVPVYKVETYLPRCVDSILEQTYSDIQVILVNDGSPDNCGAICDAYAAKDSRVIAVHKENGGVSSARNLGLSYVTGDYITFCDSDDAYTPEWIESLVKAAQEHQADIVLGNYIRINEEGAVLDACNHEVGMYEIATPEEKISYCFDKVISQKHAWEIWDRLFAADLILRNEIRFCESCGNFAEDQGFTLSCSMFADRIVSIDKAGYLYRTREGSMMQRSREKAKLDSVNEVYLAFELACRRAIPEAKAECVLPLFHFLIMHEQYILVLKYGEYHKMEKAVAEIRNAERWKHGMRQLFHRRKELVQYFGAYNAGRILLLTHFCLHRNSLLYRVERRLFYLLNGNAEE